MTGGSEPATVVARRLRSQGGRSRSRNARGRFSHTSSRVNGDALEEVMSLINRLRALVRRSDGQDLLEYALLVALIALVAYGAVELTGTNVDLIFDDIAAKLGG
jgi:pilus assembly protein Flp/PilA